MSPGIRVALHLLVKVIESSVQLSALFLRMLNVFSCADGCTEAHGCVNHFALLCSSWQEARQCALTDGAG